MRALCLQAASGLVSYLEAPAIYSYVVPVLSALGPKSLCNARVPLRARSSRRAAEVRGRISPAVEATVVVWAGSKEYMKHISYVFC